MTKKNKSILISKLLFFTENNKLIEENLRIADLFYEHDIALGILARSTTINILRSKIPTDYQEKINFLSRDDKNKKDYIKQNKDLIIAVIGVVNEDAIYSFNCRLPLFNPEKLISKELDISEKVKQYGLPINKFENVIDCLKAYEIHQENYFNIPFNQKFSVISLNNANTYQSPKDEERIKNIFSANLKGSVSERDQEILLILLFHLINEVRTNSYYDSVKYWGTFPSSDPENKNTSISFLKEYVRKILNGLPKKGSELLIRQKEMQSKHTTRSTERINIKSNKDFETLIVNPELVNKIEGEVVCIIDDYITNGYSAEAAKHLLLAAGAKEVIFLAFGKFGTKYYSTNYKIKGDVSSNYTYEFESELLCERVYEGKQVYNNGNNSEISRFNELI
ncbi:TPA: phosphoribosyl transferase [Staphylococcus aureus]|nr:phosphoribosyl transferase [Staphylococcus aureus]HCV0543172.1 phosphoribosyl transferase [Staphylococcus aureus]HCV2083796.1 phosphoribosyl transferase [Staphylococcus aureus]HCV2468816.1 phosphoribosyl transferase [Staphylococcus aureus]HCV2608226.1 phosphoribosyl transferase [Staphylococcus aureus]